MTWIAREIAANLLMGIPAIARRRIAAGRTSLPPTTENLRRFAFGILDDNPEVASHVVGADVCEIGPGDHLATGLVMLKAGAKSYTAVDRFPGDYAGAQAQRWYDIVGTIAGFPACAHTIAAAIEDTDALPEACFDLVISQAVGEHVSCIDAFARGTHKMLRPGGVAVHNVDFSNHGLFAGDDFLKIRPWLWRLMASNRGLPNRKSKADFVRAFSAYFDVAVARESATWASFVLRSQGESPRSQT